MDPVVSICCIAYNQANFISETIDSFLNQKTSFPFEIIIHDDASTDGTAEIISNYQRNYPEKIHAIFQTVNQFSQGIKPSPTYVWPKARGKYIALCEGDDYWIDPFKLQKQYDFLEANLNFSMCFTDAKVVDDEGKFIEYKLSDESKKDLDQDSILTYMTPPTLTVMFKKDALPNIIPKEINNVYNVDTFLFSLLTYKGDAAYLDFCSSAYRVHNNGIWSKLNKLNQYKMRIITLTTYFQRGPVKNRQALFLKINKMYTQYIDCAIDNKKFKLIVTILIQNISFNLKAKKLSFIKTFAHLNTKLVMKTIKKLKKRLNFSNTN